MKTKIVKFLDFLGILFLILLTTGWFLIPEQFKYLIITSIVFDLIGLLLNDKYTKMHAIFTSLVTIFNLCALHYEWLRWAYLIVGTLSLMGFIVLKYGEDFETLEDKDPVSKPIIDTNAINDMSKEDREKIFIPIDHLPNEKLIEKFVKFNNKIIISEYEDANKKTHYHIDIADNEEDTKIKFIDLINQSLEWIHVRQKNEKKTTMLDFYITLCQPFDFDKLNKIWEEPKEANEEVKS